MLVCVGCEFNLKSLSWSGRGSLIEISRYDRLESRYLTTSDYSALQQMNSEYPMETRTLLEDVLQVGEVNDPEINTKFLNFFQDSILQDMISDVESEYANMDDLNQGFNSAFTILKKYLPEMPIPTIYAQIGALDQSIVVGEHAIGISLDKYMGEKYPLYQKFYPDDQKKQMTRDYIIPDALSFYLISLYPMHNFESNTETARDIYVSRIQWLANTASGRTVFKNQYVKQIEKAMKEGKVDIETMLISDDYTSAVPKNSVIK